MYLRRGRLNAFEAFDPLHTALVVVDLIQHFADDGSETLRIVENVNQLAAVLRCGGGTVGWVRPHPSTYTELLEAVIGAESASHHRAATTDGHSGSVLHPGLEVLPGDIHTYKTGYSAFFPGACDLAERLAARRVDTVLIAGAVSNVCCEASARDAFSRGYRVVMLADANLGRKAEHLAALASIYRNFGDVRTVEEIATLISSVC